MIRTFEKLKIPELTPAALCKACCAHRTNSRKGHGTWPLMLLLEAPGNPDRQQYAEIAEPRVVLGDTLPELLVEATGYRDTNQLGGGNWCYACGAVYRTDTCELTHVIYYNGRLVPVAESRYTTKLTAESGFASWVRVPAPRARKASARGLRTRVQALVDELSERRGTSVSRAYVVARLIAVLDAKESSR